MRESSVSVSVGMSEAMEISVRDEKSEEEEESLESVSILSDDDSHSLKLPLGRNVDHDVCGLFCRVYLWILLLAFQAFSLAWLVIMCRFFNEPVTFSTASLSAAMGVCGSMEVLYNSVVTVLCVIQLLQHGRYNFVHSTRLFYNVCIASFLSHLIVCLGCCVWGTFKFSGKLEQVMTRELRAFRSRLKNHVLEPLWEQTQEKVRHSFDPSRGGRECEHCDQYRCCGFGNAALDYDVFPRSCCHGGVECVEANVFRSDCLGAEVEFGREYLISTMILYGVTIPYGILIYHGFRYFRPYWTVEPKLSRGTLDSLSTERDGEEAEPPVLKS